MKGTMRTDKNICGVLVRKNRYHPGFWNIPETKACHLTGRVAFTGTLKEVREAIKLAQKQIPINS